MQSQHLYWSRVRVSRRALLALPACVCSLIDSTCTLLGQQSSYWTDPSSAVEGNPMFAWLLHAGPGWFLLGELMWCAVIVLVVASLPGLSGLLVAGAVAIGHTFGALTWLIVVVPILALYPVFAIFAVAPMLQSYWYFAPRIRRG